MYEDLRDFILWLDSNLIEKVNKYYIWYKKWFQNLVWLDFYKSWIVITFVSLHKEDLNDYKDMIKNVPEKRWWGKKSTIMLKTKEDISYWKELIKQAYEKYDK
jgi:predicted transport protein